MGQLTSQEHRTGRGKLRSKSNGYGSNERVAATETVSILRPKPVVAAWMIAAFAFGALLAAFLLYAPALGGPFLFDDLGLPFYSASAAERPLTGWLAGVRPLLMFSYWLNYKASVREPWSYHAFNILLHVANSLLIFVLFSRILRLQNIAPPSSIFYAAFGAFLFLVHPLQTEAVAYIAGRSELVCGFFVLAALAVYANPAIESVSRGTAALVFVLYCCAVLSKEHAVVLPAMFLLIDTIFRGRTLREAIKQGAPLYVPIAIAGAVATAGIFALLARSATAGFNVSGMQWYEYFFTQFKVWFLYLGLALLPFRQNADYDIALSHSPVEPLTAVALLGLILLGALVWRFRERYPLLFVGALTFAIFLAPTSSIVPIQDLAAERRMYIPLIGLLLILLQVVMRWRLTATMTVGLVAYTLICCALTYDRTKVWSSDTAFWKDIVERSPNKARGYTHLAFTYIRSRNCSEAMRVTQSVPEPLRDTPELLGMLGQAYLCERRIDEAVKAFERAVQVEPTLGRYLLLATTYRNVGRIWDAENAEQQGLKLPPRTPYDFAMLETFHASTRSRQAETIQR